MTMKSAGGRPMRKQALLAGAALLAVVLGLRVVQPSAAPLPADLAGALPRLVADHRVCTAVVTVIKAGRVGETVAATGCPQQGQPGPDSIFQAASLAKPVFAHAVWKRAQEGLISLDEPLMRHLPDGYLHRPYPFRIGEAAATKQRVTAPELARVTPRMALNHSAGLPNWVDEAPAFLFEPGAAWSYSGEGYVLAQRALEAVAGRHFSVESQAMLAELGMHHTAFIWQDCFARDFVPASNSDGTRADMLSFTEAIGAGTVYTSTGDYARFIVALLADKAALAAVLERPATADKRLGINWGLGWAIEGEAGRRFILHWGICPGYRAFAIASAETGDGFVMLTNSDDGLALAKPVTRILLPGEHSIFRFHMLQTGLGKLLCEKLGICV